MSHGSALAGVFLQIRPTRHLEIPSRGVSTVPGRISDPNIRFYLSWPKTAITGRVNDLYCDVFRKTLMPSPDIVSQQLANHAGIAQETKEQQMNFISQNPDADNLTWSDTMRFGAMILACVLLAASVGQSLTPQMAQVCYLFGMTGQACCFCLELVADHRRRRHTKASLQVAENRLSNRLQAEHKMPPNTPYVNSEEPRTGNVESAMDSTADMSAYLGPISQASLSV